MLVSTSRKVCVQMCTILDNAMRLLHNNCNRLHRLILKMQYQVARWPISNSLIKVIQILENMGLCTVALTTHRKLHTAHNLADYF